MGAATYAGAAAAGTGAGTGAYLDGMELKRTPDQGGGMKEPPGQTIITTENSEKNLLII